ncbi:CBS domain-containing protein [Enterovirga sp.]|mgnify:CR=1 FL=1|uniref:CBS domain-containing protein n=1 Tax=Enterovirga sp. TaxID=2026350 RepID=UPI002C840817|nr:CBS domain-containing protein [Enterovirga sp.]HMO28361.1 CBS domain-containing protein [Enterovirga sp.]
MRVADVLTWGIVSVKPEDSLDRVIELMLERRISGLPVVNDNGELVGMLTEGDLLRRVELGTEKKRPRWLEFLAGAGTLAEEYSRARGRRVGELMTERVLTADLDESLDDVINRMIHHKVKRLPVLDGKKVVGVISRADILRALGRAMPAAREEAPQRDDAALLDEVRKEMAKLPFATDSIEVSIENGAVRLVGAVTDNRERNAIRIAAENVPGVRSVRDEMAWLSPLGLSAF